MPDNLVISSDVIIPEVLIPAMTVVEAQPRGRHVQLIAAVGNADLRGHVNNRGIGKTCEIPVVGPLAATYQAQKDKSDVKANRKGVKFGKQVAFVVRDEEAYGVSGLAVGLTPNELNPMAYIASRILSPRNDVISGKIHKMHRGVFAADNYATIDLTRATVLGADPVLFDEELFYTAMGDIGVKEEVIRNAIMWTHPKVKARMKALDINAFEKPSERSAWLDAWKGFPILSDDRLVFAANEYAAQNQAFPVYEIYFIAPGALIYEIASQVAQAGNDSHLIRDLDSGENSDNIIDRIKWSAAINGASFEPANLGDIADTGPTATQLATAANWKSKFEDVRNTGLIRFLVRG